MKPCRLTKTCREALLSLTFLLSIHTLDSGAFQPRGRCIFCWPNVAAYYREWVFIVSIAKSCLEDFGVGFFSAEANSKIITLSFLRLLSRTRNNPSWTWSRSKDLDNLGLYIQGSPTWSNSNLNFENWDSGSCGYVFEGGNHYSSYLRKIIKPFLAPTVKPGK